MRAADIDAAVQSAHTHMLLAHNTDMPQACGAHVGTGCRVVSSRVAMVVLRFTSAAYAAQWACSRQRCTPTPPPRNASSPSSVYGFAIIAQLL